MQSAIHPTKVNIKMAHRVFGMVGVVSVTVAILATLYGITRANYQSKVIGSRVEKAESIQASDDTTAFGIVGMKNGKVYRWNAGMSAMAGFRFRDMVDSDLSRIAPTDDDAAFSLIAYGRQPVRYIGPVTISTKDGRQIELLVNARDITGKGGETFRVMQFDYLLLVDFELPEKR